MLKQPLILIDGNNLGYRVFWTHKTLVSRNQNTGLLYGFFRSLISFRKEWPDNPMVVVWDFGGSFRRKREAQEAVDKGLIASGYKANRPKELTEEMECIFEQLDEMRQALKLTNVYQAQVKGYEADDIIYTYVIANQRRQGQTVVITSDQDFYQLLFPGVKIFDAMKKENWSRERFVEEFGFQPELWVDVGGLAGDSSDNIPGVAGWGLVWANKYVQQYGDLDSILTALKNKEKRGKKEQDLLDHEVQARLSKSLKKMDFVPDLPKLRKLELPNLEALKSYFLEHSFASLLKDAEKLA